ncbi:MAG: hypothetical protein WBN04_17225 [Paracoccaceae bacterium]
MRHVYVFIVALFGLAACETTPVTTSVERLPLMGGYRDMGDQCVRVGENAVTNQYMDDSADLVGCPEDYEGLGVFQTETGAVQVGAAQGYLLFSVPRG